MSCKKELTRCGNTVTGFRKLKTVRLVTVSLIAGRKNCQRAT